MNFIAFIIHLKQKLLPIKVIGRRKKEKKLIYKSISLSSVKLFIIKVGLAFCICSLVCAPVKTPAVIPACSMARESGTKNVFAMDINPERLVYAEKFGANMLVDANLSLEEIRKLYPKEKIDIIIDTTEIPAVMELGIEILSIGGTAVWIGAVFNPNATKINAEMIVRNLITIKGLHNYNPNDLGYAVDFIAKNYSKYPFEELVGKEFLLEELPKAFESAKSGKHYRVGIKQ